MTQKLKTLFYLLIVITGLFVSILHVHGQPINFTLDFEEGNLRGWVKTGNAFDYQPTLENNAASRGWGDIGIQGIYWIGTYEMYQELPGQKKGGIQGDRPTGTLTSAPFTIPSGALSFLIGGGSGFGTRVELVIIERDTIENVDIEQRVYFISGENTEAMNRATWDLNPYAGKTGRIRIVDESFEGWGHINVDDFRFTSGPKISEMMRATAIEKIKPQKLKPVQPTYRVILEADITNPPIGKSVRFKGIIEPEVKAAKYRFDFGDGTQSEWLSVPEASHTYKKPGTFVAVLTAEIEAGVSLAANIRERTYQSSRLAINVREIVLNLRLISSPPIYVGQPALFEVRPEPDYPDLQYQFRFGDDQVSEWTNQPRIEHRYEKEGTYRVIAVARIGEEISLRSNFVAVQIAPAPVTYIVGLEAEPQEIRQGNWVRFRARLNPEISGAEYRFQFGDGTESNWVREPQIEHMYSIPGVFQAFVIARRAEKIMAESNPVTIEVLPSDYRIFLEAGMTNPPVGQRVRFRGVVEPGVEAAEYRFNFGDGTQSEWLSAPETDHAYENPGTFSVVLTARIGERTFFSNRIDINVRESRFGVVIEARPMRAKPGDTVVFRAEIRPYVREIEYQFVYGDDEMRDWSDESVAEHAYSRDGTYRAYVRVRRDQQIVSESSRILIKIEKRRPLILWGGIGATLVLIFGAGVVLLLRVIRSRKINRYFRATFQARPKKDIGDQQTESGIPVRSDYEVRLKPVLDRGKQEIEAEGSLIIQERREDE